MIQKVLKFIRSLLFDRKFLTFSFWIWLAVISILSVLPKIPNTDIDMKVLGLKLRTDYAEHFIQFALLAFLYLQKAKITTPFKWRINLSTILLLLSTFAIATEIVQIPLPERSFNPIDLACNLAGFWAVVFYYLIKGIPFQKKG